MRWHWGASKRQKEIFVVDVFQIQHGLNRRTGGPGRCTRRRTVPQAAVLEDTFDHIGLNVTELRFQ